MSPLCVPSFRVCIANCANEEIEMKVVSWDQLEQFSSNLGSKLPT